MQKFSWLAAALMLSAACGDDDEDKTSPAIAGVCQKQCQRGLECQLLTEADVPECQSTCEDVNTDLTKECPFSNAEAEACGDDYAEQACEEILDAVVPDSCIKTCMTTTM